MAVMEDPSSKSWQALLAQKQKKEIPTEDYYSKIETWLKLADQMLGTKKDSPDRS